MPAVRWLWDERATGPVPEFLEDARAGYRASAREMLGPQGQGGEAEGEG